MSEESIAQSRRGRLTLAAFDLLYRNAALYWLASTIPFAGQWRRWQQLVLPRLHGHDILEVGCGPGWLLADIVTMGYRAQAIDASPQMVSSARATLRRRHLTERDVAVTQSRVQSLPFADAQFDTVVSTFPAPYIADPASLREIARVLRPGGRLIVVEGANLVPRGPLIAPLIWLQRLVYGRTAVDGPPSPALTTALAQRIPLATAGMTSAGEFVEGPFWRVFIVTGQKPTAQAKLG